MGICLGGHLAFRAAMQPDVLATTCFYATDIHKRSLGAGTHDNSLDRIGEITGELLMIWGRQDPHIPREGRALIYNAMSDAGGHFQWHEVNAAHAFLRDEGPRYDPATARICYDMVLEHSFTCPFCGEEISMVLDLSVHRHSYVEDCEVCCNPLEISYTVEDDALAQFEAKCLE
jgi:dienelactone hydrolase